MKEETRHPIFQTAFFFTWSYPQPFQTFSCHLTCGIRAKWSRNDHNNITSSYTSGGAFTFFVVLIHFMDFLEYCLNPVHVLSCMFHVEEWVSKTLVSVMALAWLSRHWHPLGDHQNIIKCSDPHGQAWSQVIRRISPPKHSFIHRKCNYGDVTLRRHDVPFFNVFKYWINVNSCNFRTLKGYQSLHYLFF